MYAKMKFKHEYEMLNQLIKNTKAESLHVTIHFIINLNPNNFLNGAS